MKMIRVGNRVRVLVDEESGCIKRGDYGTIVARENGGWLVAVDGNPPEEGWFFKSQELEIVPWSDYTRLVMAMSEDKQPWMYFTFQIAGVAVCECCGEFGEGYLQHAWDNKECTESLSVGDMQAVCQKCLDAQILATYREEIDSTFKQSMWVDEVDVKWFVKG